VSDSNVDGLNTDLLEMSAGKIDQLLEKFSPEQVNEIDEILDLPWGSTARYVRIKAIDSRLDERAADIARVVEHNEGEGAAALAVGRCGLTASKPVLNAPMVSALETRTS
jgi:hypothetical protein